MPGEGPSKIEKVVVHPLVLLSVVDHFNRMGKVGNVKRVVGVLLGSNRQGVLDISNSFAGKEFVKKPVTNSFLYSISNNSFHPKNISGILYL